jgi:hypothetical protein
MLAAGAGSAVSQEIPVADRDALLGAMNGATRNVGTVSLHALAIDVRLTDLVVALSQRFKIRYRLPKAADPADALRGLCPRCEPRELIAAGYAALETRLKALRNVLDGRTPFQADAVQAQVQQAVLLAAALKSYALLEAIGFRSGGRIRSGTVEGSAGAIPDWPGAAALLGGTGDVVADHLARMLDRRRQAEAVGLEYPNADLGWLVPCLRNCGP